MREVHQHGIGKLGTQAFILLHNGLDLLRLFRSNDWYFHDS